MVGVPVPVSRAIDRWMGSVHAIIYGVQEGIDEKRDGGIKKLRRRMDAAP